MPSMKHIAFAMIFVGVIVNNYVFLHDVFVGKYTDEGAGWILLGAKSYIVIGITFATVIGGSLLMLLRSERK